MRIHRPLVVLVLLAALGAAAACLDESVTGTRPLGFSMSAEPTTLAVDEQVTFSFTGQGTNVVAVIVAFGDGTADTLTYPAAVEVVDQTMHSYDLAGEYTAVGTVVASNGRLSDEVVVTVN